MSGLSRVPKPPTNMMAFMVMRNWKLWLNRRVGWSVCLSISSLKVDIFGAPSARATGDGGSRD